MKKRIFLILLSASAQLTYSIAATHTNVFWRGEANAHHQVQVANDTIVRDLGDLEAEMTDSVGETATDTAYYGARRLQNFNALKYVLDSRHRYKGDTYVNRGLLGNTYFTIGGGVSHYYNHGEVLTYTPMSSFRLAVGKDFSPMLSLRLGYERTWGYTHSSATVFNTNKFNGNGLYADVLYNFSNYLMGYRPERPFSVVGFFGLGAQHSTILSWLNPSIASVGGNLSGTSLDAHAGVQFRFFASPHASLSLEPYFKVSTDKMNLLNNPGYSDPDFSYGMNLAYQWYFNQQISTRANAGVFKKRFNNDLRWLADTTKAGFLRFPMFFDYGFGPLFVGKTANMSLAGSMGFDASAAMGWWMAPAIGLRSGIHITNGDWKRSVHGAQTLTYLVGTAGLNIDFLFNPLGFKRKYNWDAPFGFNLFAGYEMGRMKKAIYGVGNSYTGRYTSFRLGTQLWMRLANDLRLTLEPSFAPLQHYNGNLERERYDEYSLKMGLSVLFRDKRIRDKVELKDSSMVRYLARGFFFGAGLGWNNTVWDYRLSGFSHSLLKNATLFGGYNFTELHGLRVQGEWMKETQGYFNFAGGGMKNYAYNSYLVSLDYQFGLSNFMSGYNPLRRWNTYLYAGPTLVTGDQGTHLAANAGGMLTYNITPSLALFYSHTVYRLPKDYYPYQMVYSKNGTYTNNINVGVIYNIDASKHVFDIASQNRFFYEYAFGPSFLSEVPLGTINARGFSATTSLGWWLTSSFAVRAGLHVSNADWNTHTYAGRPTKLLVGTRGLAVDALVNPLGLVENYNWNSKFGFNLLAGYEFGHSKRTEPGFVGSYEGTYSALRLGTQLWARLAEGLRLTVEPTYSPISQRSTGGIKFNEFAVKAGISVLYLHKNERVVGDTTVVYNPEKGAFMGVGMGWNNTVWDWRFTGFTHSVLKNAILLGGYRFDPLHAVRVQGEWMKETQGFFAPTVSGMKNYAYNNFLVSFDYQFGLSNFLTGYNPMRRWNAYLYAGPTLLMGDGGTKFALNGGGMVTYSLSPALSLFYTHTVYRMPKHRYPQTMVYSENGTYTNNLNIGVLYNFDPTKRIFDVASQNRFFYEYAFGTTFTGRVPMGFANARGFSATTSIGWWLTSSFAARAGLHVENADWNSHTYAGQPTKLLVGTRGLALDVLVNPLGFVENYDWNSNYGFNVLAGYELGHSKRTEPGFVGSYEGKYTAFRLGAQLWTRLADGLRLTLEPTYSPVIQRAAGGIRYNQFAVKAGISVLYLHKEERILGDTTVVNNPEKGAFIAGGIGWNNTTWDWRFSGFKHSVLKNAVLFGGYRFDALHGVRLQGEWMKETQGFFNNAGPGMKNYTYNNYLLSLDYQFGLSNFMTGYNPLRRWNAYLYAGPTLVMGEAGTKFGWNGGGMVTYSINPSLSLFYMHTVYRMPKHRYPQSMVYSEEGTYTNNLNVGVMYNFDAVKQIMELQWKPRFFFDYSYGMSFLGKVPESFASANGFDANMAMGWWLSSAIGARAGVHVINADWKSFDYHNNPSRLLIGSRGISFDVLINPFGFTRDYNWESKYGVNVFGGFEFGHSKRAEDNFSASYEGRYTAARVGAQFWARLGSGLRLTVEPTFMPISQRGNDAIKFNSFALKAGVSVLFKDKEERLGEASTEDTLRNVPRTGLFVGAGFGWNNTLWDWRFTKNSRGIINNATAFAGYNFDAVSAARVGFEWMKETIAYPVGPGQLNKQPYTNYLVSFDYQLNVLNALVGYDGGRRWNVYLYAGPSLLLGEAGTAFALNGGGMISYNLTRNVSLFYSHTVYRMPKDRYPHNFTYTQDGTFTNNVNIGVMYNFNSFGKVK